MRYLAELKENDGVLDHYLCANKQVLKTKAGKTYYSLRLQDKSGTIDAKIWDLNDGINHFDEGDYIRIDGTVVLFQGGMQLNIRRVRKSSEGEYDPREYIPVSNRNIDEMYQELMEYVAGIENKYLKQLVDSFFVEDKAFIKKFKEHTAAKTMHHNFSGGLLEHTLSVVDFCSFYAKQFPIIDKDLLFTAALFHDVGKLEELSSFPIVEYTDSGQLLGHIMISVEWVGNKIREIIGFPEKLAYLVKHCIISHHGELEYGSPKKPQIIEAFALNFADNTDAKLKSISSMLENDEAEEDWIGWQRALDSNIRRTRY
ncbi:MAG: hydrolase [Firmicutes bacterium HGW-Firmicutes-1]|jgi:3'-5' exoribonuclease|nr:MAG: hydrolase [Firmicutes bacterium HGW-Firmicutes-1]